MSRIRAAIAAAALLVAAGCAPTPERPAQRFDFRLASSPYAAAICIARNARSRPGQSAEERTVGASSTEVIVRGRGGATLATARVDEAGTFSSASVLVTPAAGADHEGFARQLMQGC